MEVPGAYVNDIVSSEESSSSVSDSCYENSFLVFESKTEMSDIDHVLKKRQIVTRGDLKGLVVYLVEARDEGSSRYVFVKTVEGELFRWSVEDDGSLSKFATSLYQYFVKLRKGRNNLGQKNWRWILTEDEYCWLRGEDKKCSEEFLNSLSSSDTPTEIDSDDEEWGILEKEAIQYEKEAKRLIKLAKTRREEAEKGRALQKKAKRAREEFEENCRETQDLLINGMRRLQDLHEAFQKTMDEQAQISKTLKKSRTIKE